MSTEGRTKQTSYDSQISIQNFHHDSSFIQLIRGSLCSFRNQEVIKPSINVTSLIFVSMTRTNSRLTHEAYAEVELRMRARKLWGGSLSQTVVLDAR